MIVARKGELSSRNWSAYMKTLLWRGLSVRTFVDRVGVEKSWYFYIRQSSRQPWSLSVLKSQQGVSFIDFVECATGFFRMGVQKTQRSLGGGGEMKGPRETLRYKYYEG